jgi:hypothetical protein
MEKRPADSRTLLREKRTIVPPYVSYFASAYWKNA